MWVLSALYGERPARSRPTITKKASMIGTPRIRSAATTLAALAEASPERDAVVARELTKLHEEFVRGTLTTLAARRGWRGELTIVLGPHDPAVGPPVDVDARIEELLSAGGRAKDVAKMLAEETKLSVRELYSRIIERGQDPRTSGEDAP